MGLLPGKRRDQITDYLEEMKMRGEDVEWPRKDVSHPGAGPHFRPLGKSPPTEMLREKQAEINCLLHETGHLLTSSADSKRLATQLYGHGKRPRIG